MRFRSRGPSEEVVSFSFTTKYNSFFFALQIAHYPKTLGALFPFTQNVRFEFSVASCSEWNNGFQNFQKRGQPREVYPSFRFFLPEVFFPFNFALGFFLEFWIEWFTFRKFNSFRNFCKLFCTICRCFQIFESFAWMESDHVFNFLQILINLTSPKSPQLRFLVNNPCSWCIDTCSKNIQSKIIKQIKPLLRATFKNW